MRVRPRAWAALAIGLAVAGALVNLLRPVAPDPGTVATELDTFSAGLLRAVAAYRTPRYVTGIVALLLGVAVPGAFVATRVGRRVTVRLAGPREHAPLRAALVAVAITVATAVVTLPVAFFVGYVQTGRFGFRTQGLVGWLRDWSIGVGVSAAIAVVAGLLVAWLLHRAGQAWPFQLTVAGTVVAAALVLATPVAIQPLFLDTRPLGDVPGRAAVEEVLVAAGLEDLPILVADASRRTTMVNAFVTGLGPTRQVVVYDTLLELPQDQVAITVAHELAHRLHADIPRGVLLTATGLLPTLLVLRRVLASARVQRWLAPRGPADPRLIAVVATVVALAQVVALPVANLVSRRAEAAADHRAVELAGRADTFVRLARTFTVRDLSDPEPPAWAMALWGTHPAVSARIERAVAQARAQGLALPDLAEVRADERDVLHRRARDAS